MTVSLWVELPDKRFNRYTTPEAVAKQLIAPLRRANDDYTPITTSQREIDRHRDDVGGIQIIQINPLKYDPTSVRYAYWRMGFIYNDGATREFLVKGLRSVQHRLRQIAVKNSCDIKLVVGTQIQSGFLHVKHPFFQESKSW